MNENDFKNSINILFASNDAFSPYLGVSIYSLLKNNINDFEKINIFILDDKISENHKEKIIKISKKFNQEIKFIKIANIESIFGKSIVPMKKEGVTSLTAYARLLAASLLKDIDKILYLDADSLVVNSFKDLWRENIDEYYIAGVVDTLGVDFIKKEIGLEKSHKYINTGVMLINLKKWREEHLEEKFMNFLIKHLDKFIYHDQGIINGVCKDKILYIHPKYNFQGQFHGIDYDKATKWAGFPNYYDEKTVKESQENPVFIHFTGNFNRPWSNKNQEYHEIYFRYVNETPFKDELKFKKLPSKTLLLFYSIYKSSVMTLFLKILPMSFTKKLANERIKYICKHKK